MIFLENMQNFETFINLEPYESRIPMLYIITGDISWPRLRDGYYLKFSSDLLSIEAYKRSSKLQVHIVDILEPSIGDSIWFFTTDLWSTFSAKIEWQNIRPSISTSQGQRILNILAVHSHLDLG